MAAFCNALIAAPFAYREGRLAPALSVLSLLVVFFCDTLAAQPRPADLVIFNAAVHTMTPRDSVQQAIAVKGNRITATGTNKLVKTFIGPSTVVMDAGGRLVLPGFNDAHVHFMGIGNGFSSIDLRDVKSAAEMTERIARYVKFLPKGRWILGGHFDNKGWDLPDRKSLDAIAPDNPLFLYRAGAAAAIANSLAFNIAKVKDSDAELDVSPTGEPTGIVRGRPLRQISLVVPANQTTNWLEIAETATNYAASLGVTSVQDMQSDDSRAVYRQMERQGKLKTRVYDCLPLSDWSKLKTSRLPNHPGAMVTDGCLKGFSDGDDDEKTGLLRNVIAADQARLQVMVHAIGPAANHIVLDVFERAIKTNGPRDRRLRIEHAHNSAGLDLPRFSRSHIIASMQPFLFEGREGSRYGTLLRQGALVAFGSDALIVDLNPLLGISAAVNHGSESVSVYEAVRAYTLGSAYAQFQEKEKGTIEPGKLADFVILSDDIFAIGRSAIRDARVVTTVVNGKIVYRSN
ncbi:MAG: amidohydrolase [Pyrinomonadaceae bacterium]